MRRKIKKICHNCEHAEFYKSFTRLGSGYCTTSENKPEILKGQWSSIDSNMHCRYWSKQNSLPISL